MKYLQLNKEQKQKFDEINQIAENKIPTQKFQNSWLISYDYFEQKEYDIFQKSFLTLEIVELDLNSNSFVYDLLNDLKEQLNQLNAQIEKKTEIKQLLEEQLAMLNQLVIDKNSLTTEIASATTTVADLDQSIIDIQKQIDAIRTQIAKKKGK